MNHLIRNNCIILLFVIASQKVFAQQKTSQLTLVNTAYNTIDQIQTNPSINADSAFNILSNWSAYPVVEQTGKDYLFYYTDPFYGVVPVRVYIPSSYKNTQKFPCILMLHGATGGSKFADIDTVKKFDDDIIFSTVKQQQYIIVRPVADRGKFFNWSVNNRSFKNKNAPNLTYKTLTNILVEIKKVLNIDDNKTFALGHSDGADGAIGFAVYNPNPFAGIVAYNSMMDNIFARDFYIRNIINSPLYIVHSDLDKLRPIQKTRMIVDSLKKIDDKIIYKEYIGYQHYDKHLTKDLPLVPLFINSTSRNPFKTTIYWETDKVSLYNSCNWIKITQLDTAGADAKWFTTFNPKTSFKYENQFKEINYYGTLNKSSAIKASYYNNTFSIETSLVAEVEINISPFMVNLEQPVTIIINGGQTFSGKVVADKKFITDGFKSNFDRDVIWVTSIKVKTNQP